MKEKFAVGDKCWIRVDDFYTKPPLMRRGTTCEIKILEIGMNNLDAWAEVIDEKKSAKRAKKSFHKVNLERASKTLDGLKSLYEFKEGDLVSVYVQYYTTSGEPKLLMGVVLKSKKILAGNVAVSLEGFKNMTIRSDRCILISRPKA